MTIDFIYLISSILGIFLGTQWVSVLLFFAIEWAMVDFYKLGTFENATSILDKLTNFFMMVFLGSGYFLYKKFSGQKWLVRKLSMFIALCLQGIISIIIYYLLTVPLNLIVDQL
ncbi:hypothetical protein [Metabacillus malikii]|uniref:DUF5658 domain-containing protein n=1 Tax=Metabacillus malikii TaxID=1504265 RepID=A0ABT9ZEG8_9BACI|nr:hypothetical protein [Metabacillus malikii]MDQ0230664.1 hypothetical protein [Metabacillus malikii]